MEADFAINPGISPILTNQVNKIAGFNCVRSCNIAQNNYGRDTLWNIQYVDDRRTQIKVDSSICNLSLVNQDDINTINKMIKHRIINPWVAKLDLEQAIRYGVFNE